MILGFNDVVVVSVLGGVVVVCVYGLWLLFWDCYGNFINGFDGYGVVWDFLFECF